MRWQEFRCTNVLQMHCSTFSLQNSCNILDKLLSGHCLNVSPKMLLIFVLPKSAINSCNFLIFEICFTFEPKFVTLQLKSRRTPSVFWGYSEKKVPPQLFIITLCHNSSFSIWRQDGVFPYLISSLKPIFLNKMTASLEIVSLALFLFVLVSVLLSPCFTAENQTEVYVVFITVKW